MKGKYKLMKAEGTTCPDCFKEVWLLSNDGLLSKNPAFYICFKCKRIGEVGVGKVEIEKSG